MENNVFLIKWYGPFDCTERVEQWEKEHKETKCLLYLLHGKLKYAKTRERYYCGMSIRHIYKRLTDTGHHIQEIQGRLNSIYVGQLANVKRPTRNLNATNTLFPSEDVFVINEWWKTTGDSVWKRQPINAPSNIVPDVLVFHYNGNGFGDLSGCKKLKAL